MITPAYLVYYVNIGAIGMMAVLFLGLNSALHNAGWAIRERAAAEALAAISLVGWFLLSSTLARFDFFRVDYGRIPTIQYGIVSPILIGGVLIWRSARLARVIDAIPQQWLIQVQLYRVLGAIFLILYAAGRLPGLFAWPAGLGDVLVGVLAPVVAVAYARSPNQNVDLVLMWNLFGIADLIIAVTMGFLTSPSAFQSLAFDRPSELVSQFPLVMIPVFLVPVSVLLHLASLMKLRRDVWQRHLSRTAHVGVNGVA